MGCGASKDIDIDPIDVPDTERGYPPPKPPRDRKDNVFKEKECATIDANAKGAPKTIASDYGALISYLTKDARNDVQKVRAIYSWLAAQPIYSMKFPNVKDAHSPEGYMKTIQQGDGSYTAFFALLCRAAKIPCVIIHGSGKAAGYEVGEQPRGLNSAWNAVHVDGSWRLVHVFWALVGLQGFNKGGWTKVEEGGKAVREKEQASKGKTVNTQQDFWFLTDPDQFIYLCRAKNVEWQLLKTPWSMDKFVNVPHFSPNYFHSGFKLTSQEAAILRSETGKCDITFQHSETVDAELDYTLLFDEENSKEKISQSLQLEKYVIKHGNLEEKTLCVRFPVCGVYKVEVTGSGSFKSLLASFRLVCDKVMKDVHPYPINPKIGFGYSKVAQDVGLTKPSQIKGIIVVRQGEIVKFQFYCKAKLELQTLLVHKDKGAEELASYVTQDRSGDDVTVTVTVPEHAQNPEYALQLNARQAGSSGGYDNVINYLLTHRMEKESTTDERAELVDATESRDIERLEKAIRDFEHAHLPDKGDLSRARRILLSLHEQAIKSAIEQRKLETLEAAIKAAKNSSVAPELREGETLPEAESLLSLLRRLKRYLHKILELKQTTVSEIHSYRFPPRLVHPVMKATYCLLGEREEQLQRWEYIQALLRRQGRDSIIRRIKEFDVVHMTASSTAQASAHLQLCDINTVRLTSAGAAAFFVWSSNIINEAKTRRVERPRR